MTTTENNFEVYFTAWGTSDTGEDMTEYTILLESDGTRENTRFTKTWHEPATGFHQTLLGYKQGLDMLKAIGVEDYDEDFRHGAVSEIEAWAPVFNGAGEHISDNESIIEISDITGNTLDGDYNADAYDQIIEYFESIA